jgi:hypothetical protein
VTSPDFFYPQENLIAAPGTFTQSAIITSEFPESRFHLYDTNFERNLYNKPAIQVSHSQFVLLKLIYRLPFRSLKRFVLLRVWEPLLKPWAQSHLKTAAFSITNSFDTPR